MTSVYQANGHQRFEVDAADKAARLLGSSGVGEPRVGTVARHRSRHDCRLAHRFGPVEAVAKTGIAAEIISVQEKK
jgi:hypothetical protein